MTEKEAYIALNMVQSVGAATVGNGIERLGSAVKFFTASAARLASVKGISRAIADELATAFATVDWQSEIARAKAQNVKFLTPVDDDYPPLLRQIHYPPLALYITGDPAALCFASIAMVGTRSPTTYGLVNAKTFSYRLAQSGICVVSGLARGIDTEAHRGALLAGGRTVAVIGSALDKLYPYENRGLARQIVKSGGAVVTEYPFGRSADRQTFPMRNRIISGLSSAVLVVEAGVYSGTLITVDHALEQGRSVMAIPGRIDSAVAQGCHKLIKNGARLVETPEEVLDEMQTLPNAMAHPAPGAAAPTESQPAQRPKVVLDDVEKKIIEVLADGEMTPDALVNATGLRAAVVSPRIVSLEMKCQLERTHGNVVRLRKNLL